MTFSRSFLPVTLLSLFIISLSLAGPTIQTVRPDGTPNKAAWMAQGAFGVMTHYLVTPKGNTPEEKTADLNRIVNQFDVDGYVQQIEATGADWVIFTICQGTGYLSTHEEFIDQIEAGYSPSRDLIPELGKKLHEHGKRLILYIPWANTPADPNVKRILGMGSEGYADRHNDFIRHFALKMGKNYDGWWFDSCAPQDESAWRKEMEACRAGNSEAVIAFSGAEFCATNGKVNPICPIEDYHPGEIHLLEDGKIRTDFIYPPGEGIYITADSKLRKQGKEATYYMPDAQFIGGVQWHGLLPIDLTFNPAVPNQYCHYSDKVLFRFVEDIKSVGGALTINVPIDIETGHIPDDSHSQLVRLGQHLQCKQSQ